MSSQIAELAKEALKEIMATEGKWKEKDFAYFVESFDFCDSDYPNCNKLYVAVTQDMVNWLAYQLDSINEIQTHMSSYAGGEISVKVRDIDNRVINAVLDQAKKIES